ncbi:hypothetical protein BRADI_2g01882v3 [Brachypodium distachyon]|uniref:Uncharacterized protein n=1 Tax=Brachypodium distachyon TaxID=15368 RepID=A0A2K2D6H1_BRADI|nr:hypothetical protein BRADI_2g01882v3 [Brachypodium distachyon]
MASASAINPSVHLCLLLLLLLLAPRLGSSSLRSTTTSRSPIPSGDGGGIARPLPGVNSSIPSGELHGISLQNKHTTILP